MTEQSNVTKKELKTALSLAIGRKSILIAYILWFFLGFIGGHRFYLGKKISAIVMLMLFLIGSLLSMVGVGLIFFAILGLWWIIDSILIFIAAQKTNDEFAKLVDNLEP